MGAERIVWGSDYPHHDATFPGAVDALRRTIAPMTVDAQALILGQNARSLYRLPSRFSGAAGTIRDYFTAVTLRDGPALGRLFAPDAELWSGEARFVGADAIRRFYEEGAFSFDDLLPQPGPLDIHDGERCVEVTINLRIAGSPRLVHDVFELTENRITRLEIQTIDD